MITLTSVEIENYAMQIEKMKTPQEMIPIIGHLAPDDADAVVACVLQIHDQHIAEMKGESDSWENLARLAKEAGCPREAKVLPWLQERGLAIQVEGGWRFKPPAKPVL